MTATEELRRLLDERGVEHEDYAYAVPVIDELSEITRVRDMAGRIVARFMSCHEPGKVDVAAKLTPERAVAATLGTGTCEVETTESWLPAERYHRCKHCGAFFAVLDASHDIQPHVCPNCGRRVERGK